MVTVIEACGECTQNCYLMHEKLKDPDPVSRTFFKVLIGENYSDVLFLPPRFAHSVQHLVGKETHLADSSAEKWPVKFTRVEGSLAFQDGWNKFSSDHGLKLGDLLVFHYIKGSHFVVKMYGPSGCPENRHFGLKRHRTMNEKPSFRSEIRRPRGTENRKRKTKRKRKSIASDDYTPSNANVQKTSGDSCLRASSPRSTDKETRQRSEPPGMHTSPCSGNDNERVQFSDVPGSSELLATIVPRVVEPVCLVDEDSGNVEEENRRSCSHDQSDGGAKNDPSSENQQNENGNVLETQLKEPAESRKKTTVMPKDTRRNSIEWKSILRSAGPPIKKCKLANVVAGTSDKGDVVAASNGKMKDMAEKELATARASDKDDTVAAPNVMKLKEAKKESNSLGDSEPLVQRLHNTNHISASRGTFLEHMAKLTEMAREELSVTRGLDFLNKASIGNGSKDTQTGGHSSLIIPKKEVKTEASDFDEEPSLHGANATFSSAMESHKYLELPRDYELRTSNRRKVKSKVFFLRGTVDPRTWPVLYQTDCGVPGLTRGWEEFARANGLEPGDVCEFVAVNNESESLFRVRRR